MLGFVDACGMDDARVLGEADGWGLAEADGDAVGEGAGGAGEGTACTTPTILPCR